MPDKRTFILRNPDIRQRAIQAIKDAPQDYAVTVGQSTRNLEQNALLHSLISEIAETHEWAGRKHDVEVWKRLLTASWLRARGESVEVLPALDGHGVDVVFRRTSELTKAECAELINYIHAWQVMA